MFSNAFAFMDCDSDTIKYVGRDGATLTMWSGSIWKVSENDQANASIWLSTEDVTICYESLGVKGNSYAAATITNKHESGDKVRAQLVGAE